MTRPMYLFAAILLVLCLLCLVSCDLLLDGRDGAMRIPGSCTPGSGDVNTNGLPYEIADAVMFINYFINGESAFGTHINSSIAATDVNGDCRRVSVADLVYLIRVLIGDAAPAYEPRPVAANVTVGNDRFSVDTEMGAAYIVVEGNVTPTLLVDNMEMMLGFDGQNTNVLIYSLVANQSFTGDFLQVDGNVVSTEFATSNGQPVVGKVLPATFVVEQNYPSPFWPTTKIEFVILGGGPWSLKIVDIRGRRVLSQSGVSETGFETIVWDASGLSPGVFTYTVTVGNLSESKKATLLCK